MTNNATMLTRNPDGKTYVWQGGYETRHVPKAAGFRWDPNARHWWTTDMDKAARLAEAGYAPDLLDELRGVKAKRIEALEVAGHRNDGHERA